LRVEVARWLKYDRQRTAFDLDPKAVVVLFGDPFQPQAARRSGMKCNGPVGPPERPAGVDHLDQCQMTG